MGTFATTAIITKFTTYSRNLKTVDNDPDRAVSIFAKKVVDNPKIFDFDRKKDECIWTLKSSIRKEHLPIFLKKYYADFYEEGSMYYERACKPILAFIETNPSEKECEKWLEKNWKNVFYVDDANADFYVNQQWIKSGISRIRLSYEGKVSYEEFETHLNFFQKSMRKAYADNPLGGCLYVTVE